MLTIEQAQADSYYRYMRLSGLLGSGNYNRIARETGLDPSFVSRLLRGMTKNQTIQTLDRIASSQGLRREDVAWYVETSRRDREREGRKGKREQQAA
jgi:transcriptional regulator with XRE-family HTH domain